MTIAGAFADTVVERVRAMHAPGIVGLDPEPGRMPAEFALDPAQSHPLAQAQAIERFCAEIIEAIHDLVPAVKPQAAYFERWGAPGMAALERVVELARRRGLLVILDAKRGDIGSTAEAYAAAYLARHPPRALECDALTANP